MIYYHQWKYYIHHAEHGQSASYLVSDILQVREESPAAGRDIEMNTLSLFCGGCLTWCNGNDLG